MKTLVKSVLNFLKQTVSFIGFLLRLLYHKGFSNPFKTRYEGTVAVLANGPSLKDVISRVQTDAEFQGVDFIVLNYFAFEDVFFSIKPKHYCLADPMFFRDSFRKQDAQRLFSILQERVNWAMNIYIPRVALKDFQSFSRLTNSHIQIIPLNTDEYAGYESLRFTFYQKGLSMPRPQTVANMAIYVGINSGYSQVNLYGVEHTFLDSLCVNDDNQLCNRDKHFYDKGEVQLKPIIKTDSLDEVWKIGDYLMAIAWMFKSHDMLSAYAKYKGVQVLNCTKGSMIDSYKRKR